MSLLDGSSMYNQPGMYNQGGGSVVEYEKVFHTQFSNLSSGVDTPIIGSAYSTPLTRVAGLTTPLNNLYTVGSVSSSPNGEKTLIDLSSYIQGKSRAVLKFLVKVYSAVSYATNIMVVYNPQIWLAGPGSSSAMVLLSNNNTNVYLRNSVANNRITLANLTGSYTSDGWLDFQFEIDYVEKKYIAYICGIKAYSYSFNSSSLTLTVSLWDGVTLYFTNVELWTM